MGTFSRDDIVAEIRKQLQGVLPETAIKFTSFLLVVDDRSDRQARFDRESEVADQRRLLLAHLVAV